MNANFFKKLIDVVKTAGVIFTVIVLAMHVIDESMQVEPFLFVLGFALWVSAFNLVLLAKNLNKVLKITIHYLTTLSGIYIFFFALRGQFAFTSSTLTLFFVYTIVYLIVMCCYFAVNALLNKNKEEKGDKYDSVYKSK